MASIEKIPTDPTLSDWEQVTILDGVPFTLRFRLNQRSNRYFMSIYTENGVPIILDKKVVIGRDLLRSIVDPESPAGAIFVSDQITKHDPSFGNLETSAFVAYADEELTILSGL